MPEFEAEEPSSALPTPGAKQEEKSFNAPVPKPNTVVIRLWGGGHISFNPESSVPVFALIALVLLLVSIPLITIVGLFGGDSAWMNTIMTALGHAIAAVIGAIVGSAVKGKEKE